jgi:hypothetical protein
MTTIDKKCPFCDGEPIAEVGGSSRHYINDCLLPSLADEGLSVVADHRAEKVRLVVSQQWVVAISFWWDEARGTGLDVDHPDSRWSDEEYAAAAAVCAKNMRVTRMARHFARVPPPVDVVDALLGAE